MIEFVKFTSAVLYFFELAILNFRLRSDLDCWSLQELCCIIYLFMPALASQKVDLSRDFSLEKWFVFIEKLKLFVLLFIFVDFLKPYSPDFFGEVIENYLMKKFIDQ